MGENLYGKDRNNDKNFKIIMKKRARPGLAEIFSSILFDPSIIFESKFDAVFLCEEITQRKFQEMTIWSFFLKQMKIY